jgi:transposase
MMKSIIYFLFSMAEITTINAHTSKEQLPDDTGTLKQMVLTLLGQIDDLNGQLVYLKRQLFGHKSEKLNPAQRMLFEDLYQQLQAKLHPEQAVTPVPSQRKPNATHQGRRPLPPDLEREIIQIEPNEDDKVCPVCHTEKQRIGEDVTEKLDYVPACFRVKRYVRAKYACRQCQEHVSIGSLPPMAVDKGIPAEGLLAHIITSKYADHLPLNRLEGILGRYDVDITVSTMCDWVGRCAELLEPLVKRMHDKILQSPKINTDDTTVPVKSKNRKGSTYSGYLWVYVDNGNHAVFDFMPTRSREGPLSFLKDYKGYVQADAYSGYDEFFRISKATEIGCHAHARRKFDYAMETDPVRASQMLALWKELYGVEKKAKEHHYSDCQLLHARQTESKAILEKIRATLITWKDQVLPKSLTGKAITYALNQWDALVRYTEDPMLEIDNNLAERTLRMVAVGRKNWMFAGSEAGAERAAVIYSLVASCKLNNIDPFAYFKDVLEKVTTCPASQIDTLLPSHWKTPENPADKAVA